MNTIRALIATIALALAVTLAGPALVPAYAGPSRNEPAQLEVTHKQAHRVATLGWHTYFVKFLPQPHRWGLIANCRSDRDRKVWRCNALANSKDARCTAVVLIWADDDWFYGEWTHLRCGAPHHNRSTAAVFRLDRDRVS